MPGMCRWLAYLGNPVFLETLIFEPEHSLIDQSLYARQSETTTNGDGFGIGWYGPRDLPGTYRSVRPAWNDENLRCLSAQVQSALFLAHIRASTGTAVQQTNCHPFYWDRWLLVHNGLIDGYSKIKRELVLAVAPELFPGIRGTTDSEIMFFLALTFGLDDDPLGAVERMAGFVEHVGANHGIEHPLQMTLGFADGERLYAVRYSSQRRSRTLFIGHDARGLADVHPDATRFSPDARAIVSEPLDACPDSWREVPESTAVVIERGHVETLPFAPKVPS